jgi:hypothetical protein
MKTFMSFTPNQEEMLLVHCGRNAIRLNSQHTLKIPHFAAHVGRYSTNYLPVTNRSRSGATIQIAFTVEN